MRLKIFKIGGGSIPLTAFNFEFSVLKTNFRNFEKFENGQSRRNRAPLLHQFRQYFKNSEVRIWNREIADFVNSKMEPRFILKPKCTYVGYISAGSRTSPENSLVRNFRLTRAWAESRNVPVQGTFRLRISGSGSEKNFWSRLNSNLEICPCRAHFESWSQPIEKWPLGHFLNPRNMPVQDIFRGAKSDPCRVRFRILEIAPCRRYFEGRNMPV